MPIQCWPRSPPWQIRFAKIVKPVAADNPVIAIQETLSGQIVAALDAWRDMNEALAERTFLAVYGSPTLQAASALILP